MVERPRPVSLLVIFYGSNGFFLLSVFVFLLISPYLHEASGPPGPGPADILIFFVNIVSLVGALLNLSVACGLFLAKGWARILGIAISVLGLPFLALGGLSLGVNFITDFFLAGLVGYLMYLMDVGVIILNIAAFFYLTRPVVKAYFEKKRVSERAVEHEAMKATPEEIEELPPYMHALLQWGFALGLLNLVMGVSGLIRGGAYALFVIYWLFWYVPSFASLTINVYGCWKKQVLSVIGLVLTLIGISAFWISYVSLGGRLPD